MQPKDVMMDVAEKAMISGGLFWGRPVKVFENYFKLPQETRERLADLKSDDISNVRMEAWCVTPTMSAHKIQSWTPEELAKQSVAIKSIDA